MSTTYSITFKNKTETAWHFGVYQKPPGSPGLTSVAWMVAPVPASGEGYGEFTLTFGTALSHNVGDVWSISQQRPAVMGKEYHVVFVDSNVPSIDPNPIGDAGEPNQVELVNDTNIPLSLGFTISGDLVVVQEDVKGNETAQFNVTPIYYIALFKSIKKGQMVDSAIVIGPVVLQYTDGYTAAEVSVVTENGRTVLKDPVLVAQ